MPEEYSLLLSDTVTTVKPTGILLIVKITYLAFFNEAGSFLLERRALMKNSKNVPVSEEKRTRVGDHVCVPSFDSSTSIYQ